MDLYLRIESLINSILKSGIIKNRNTVLDDAVQCERELKKWYSATSAPDYRLTKLLSNLIFYLKANASDVSFRDEILISIAKTVLRTADFDINIRNHPDKVRDRHNEMLMLYNKLRKEKKRPLEEMSSKPYDITIFMATYNQLELTKLCLESVFKNTNDVTYELYLIDNGSSDGTYEYFKNDNRIKLIRLDENTGLLLALHIFYESGLDNGKFWLYMNNDVVVTPRWASNMLVCIKSDPRIASVMPVTNRAAAFMCIQPPFGLYDIDKVQGFGESFNSSNPDKWQDWLMHYCFTLLIRPSVRRKFGYYEDCFYFSFYFSDGDITLTQAKAGYRSVQARDTYIHHFDGGHTVLQNRRKALASGEKQFFEKYGFFPTDIERSLPVAALAGATATVVGANVGSSSNAASGRTGTAANVLFLGTSRLHPLMQLQSLNKTFANNNTTYYAADTMEQLKLEQFDDSVNYQEIDSWYDVGSIFPDVMFDAVIFLDDVMKLRRPESFLKAVYERICINGKLHCIAENPGCLLMLNNYLMSHRKSARDAVRVMKCSTSSVVDLISLLTSAGFSVDSVEDNYYDEVYTYANMDSIDNYRRLLLIENLPDFERNIRIQSRNIVARKPSSVNTNDTLEELLYRNRFNCT